MFGLVKKVIGSTNDRELKRIGEYVARANALEQDMQKLSDNQLREKTDEFRKKLKTETKLEDLLPEVFAVCREVAHRKLNMRHFDVQLIGGVVLHEGKIGEMKTGEGKTLVATLAVYLNALEGKGVHVVTVNDYLARRDAEWMGQIYEGLGLTVGVIQHDMDDTDRQRAYACDVTYGTNNEFGFDYLRDNMKFSIEEMVQPELNFAIVDEVDSILIDEARTPLIISGPTEDSTDLYHKIDRLIPIMLKEKVVSGTEEEEEEEELPDSEKDAISKIKYEYLTVDEKSRTVSLNESGMPEMEKSLKKAGLMNAGSLFDIEQIEVLHHVNQALKAHVLFQRDVDYVVQENQVIIVDEFTGRTMPGRRYSEGLHQALEAKEKVKIENENQTLASITFQNYFRMYNKLAGMTGTADTEAVEFNQIYNLDVVVIPTNQSLIRTEYPDVVYRTEPEKYEAAADEIIECHKRGQPILVGTGSIENSEKLGKLLKRRGIPHNVLNAKNHAREADIIAQAGRLKAVTLSTNMAGRGTDILLGGNPDFLAKISTGDDEKAYENELEKYKTVCNKEHQEVVSLGGLHVMGTERHESRRIDNQLRGRSGRQGDPGSSRFYLSLEDNLLRIFGSDRISGIMEKFGMEEGEPIEHGMVTKAIGNAQKKVEAYHFDIRKHLLEYDDVMNKQRQVVYDLRREVIDSKDSREMLFGMIEDVAESAVSQYLDEDLHPEDWDIEGLNQLLERLFNLQVKRNGLKISLREKQDLLNLEQSSQDEVTEEVVVAIEESYKEKEEVVGEETLRFLERLVMLQIIDDQWKDHLLAMDHLKEGIGFRGYAQKNPLNEYKREGFDLFSSMMDRIKEEIPTYLLRMQVSPEEEGMDENLLGRRASRMFEHRGEEMAPSPYSGEEELITNSSEPSTVETFRREGRKIGRNELCPCGSEKKFKHCHGKS